jgi:hypothetical protein
MRRLVPALVTFSVAVAFAATGQSQGLSPAPDAQKVLAAARTALGGEARLAAVKTFIATGRTRQVRGENLIPIEFEIQVELPGKYSRRDEFPAQDAGPSTAGFVGDDLVLIPRPPPPPGRAGAPPPTPAQQEAALRGRLITAKQDFARLMLGMFAASYSSFPLAFTYVAQAEAPQGKADVIEFKGPANFVGRLFINAETHLPIMVTWQAPAGRGPAAPPPAPGGPPPAAPPAAVEQRMFFADYREVDGFRLPFRIRRAAGAETTEETTFDRFRINAKIDPRRFDTTAK